MCYLGACNLQFDAKFSSQVLYYYEKHSVRRAELG